MPDKTPERDESIGIRAGAPTWLPDDGTQEPLTNAPGTGSLATSGRDDQERGDTVSGLGTHTRREPSSGQQSGKPTPGNRE
jgi:hypothetical protein